MITRRELLTGAAVLAGAAALPPRAAAQETDGAYPGFQPRPADGKIELRPSGRARRIRNPANPANTTLPPSPSMVPRSRGNS